jgi:hypothetical protein
MSGEDLVGHRVIGIRISNGGRQRKILCTLAVGIAKASTAQTPKTLAMVLL